MDNFNSRNSRFAYHDMRRFPNAKVAEILTVNALGANHNNGYNTQAVPFILNRYEDPRAGPLDTLVVENMSMPAKRSEYGAGTRTVDSNLIKTHGSGQLSHSVPATTTSWQGNATLPREPTTAQALAVGYEMTSAPVGESSRLRRDIRLETSVGQFTRGQSGAAAAGRYAGEAPKRPYEPTAFTNQSRGTKHPSTSPVTGLHVLSGNVERVLKWRKIMQDLDVECLIEVIARCVNIRVGKKMEKHILLRDHTGPVLQVVFYEIDFLMVNIPVPSTVRIVGKMIGSNRMQAYKVRPVTGDEMTTLPRLAAISQHVVTKLEKQTTRAT